jgi:hypothetical protein
MSYFNITKTNISFESAFALCKLVQLENNSNLGDIFGEHILCSTGNPLIIKDGEELSYDNYFKTGMYVNLFPLKYIEMIESNSESFNIDGFTICKDEKIFHPLIGFDKDLNEVADLDKHKEKMVVRYIYKRNSK